MQGLLEDFYKEFEVDTKNPPFDLKQENKKVPQLTKYLYQKASLSTTDRNIMEASMGMQLDCQSANLNTALGGAASGSNDGTVKVENPKFLDLKQELNICQSMKTSMERQ